MDDLLSVDDIRTELGVSRQRVHQLIDEERLTVERFGPTKRFIRVRRSEFERYKRENLIPKALPEVAA